MTDSKSRTALPLQSILHLMDRFDDLMYHILLEENREIAESIRVFITGRGKRLRPALVMLAAGASGNRDDERIRYAILTELIHTASLFHDDVLDAASYRRGVISSNLLLGNDLSVLAGDFLYAKALSLVFSDKREIQLAANNTVLSMTKGEISQALHRFRFDGGQEHYMWIIERKTADLISLACHLGAIIQGSEKEVQQLTRYGRNIGIVYQIIDDLLDWTAEETKLGKKIFQDAREGYITLPLFLLMEKLPEKRKTELQNMLSDSQASHPDSFYRELLDLMKSFGVIEDVHNMTQSLCDEALNTLDIFPNSPEIEDLRALVPFLLNRQY